MFNFNDGLPAIIQPDHATIKSRDRTHIQMTVRSNGRDGPAG